MDPQVFRHCGWTVVSRSTPILKAAPIEAMTSALGIAPPEMIFGDNYVRLEHEETGWNIEFNAFDALDLVDKTGEKMLSVAYGAEWQESRKKKEDTAEIGLVTEPYDWSYTTDYKGTLFHRPPKARLDRTSEVANDVSQLSLEEASSKLLDLRSSSLASQASQHNTSSPPPYATAQSQTTGYPPLPNSLNFTPTATPLPLNLLTRPDPILHYLLLDIYEDELADNGLALLNIKLRIMPNRLLLLQRFFMRLDDVIFRVRDTRMYIEFATGEVVREYVEKEGTYQDVQKELEKRSKRGGGDVSEGMRDGGKVAEVLEEGRVVRERVVLGSLSRDT